MAAREGVEALTYAIDIRGLRSQNAMIGHVGGSLGEKFLFYLFVNRKAPRRLGGVPAFGLRQLRNIGPLRKTGQLASMIARRA